MGWKSADSFSFPNCFFSVKSVSFFRDKMAVIYTHKVVSDYGDLDIHNLYLGQEDRIKNGLLRILANNGIQIELKDPKVYQNYWPTLTLRYKRIVEKIEASLKKKKDKFSKFDKKALETVFFSPDEFSSLLKVENESW